MRSREAESQKRVFTYEGDSCEGTTFELLAYAKFKYDPSYGEDADGNRGVGTWFQDDVIYEEWLRNGHLIDEKDVPEEIKKDLEEQANSYDWEVE